MGTPVLVVDDSAIARKLMIRCLPEKWDVDISQATNGQEAVEAYRAGKADVMFLDLTMPVMDGYEVLKTLQNEDLNSFIVVVSADVQPRARERILKSGAMAFLKKPVDATAVTETLQKFGII